MSSSLCTLLDDITKEVLPYIDIRFTSSYYSQILWDALMSFLSNPTRTDSLVILYLKRKKTKGRAFWRLWHLFMEFNQYTSVLLLMITFEVYFFSLSWLLHSHKVFLAIAFRVRTLLTSATFRPYSGAEKEAPIETQVFLHNVKRREEEEIYKEKKMIRSTWSCKKSPSACNQRDKSHLSPETGK